MGGASLVVGLADEIAKEIDQAAERSPFNLDRLLDVDAEEPQSLEDKIALAGRIIRALFEVMEANRKAIILLAGEIDELHARIRDLEE